MALWDDAGAQEYDRLRPLGYPGTDIFLICYSIGCPSSFYNIESVWVPEIQHYCPNAAYFIVGLKEDLRHNMEMIQKLKQMNLKPISQIEGINMAKRVNAAAYVECCALTQKGLKQIFEEAIRVVISPEQFGKKSFLQRGLSFSSFVTSFNSLGRYRYGHSSHTLICDTHMSQPSYNRLTWYSVSPKVNTESIFRYGHCSFTLNQREFDSMLIVIGGVNEKGERCSNSLQFNNRTDKWDQFPFSETSPFQGLVFSASTTLHSKVYLFGGKKNLVGEITNEFFSFEIDQLGIANVSRIESKGDVPSPRYGATLIGYSQDNTDCLLLFGGCDSNGKCKKQVYIYSLSTSTWKKPKIKGPKPSSRCHHISLLIKYPSSVNTSNSRIKMLIFGGHNDKKQSLNDMFLFDLFSFTWEKIKTKGKLSPPRCYGHAGFISNDSMYIYGGKDSFTGNLHSSIYTFHFPSRTWHSCLVDSYDTHFPLPRIFHSLQPLSSGYCLLLGGLDSQGNVNTPPFLLMYSTTGLGVFQKLPWEILIYIFSFLSYQDLFRLGKVSKPLRQLSLREDLWKPHFQKLFPGLVVQSYRQTIVDSIFQKTIWKNPNWICHFKI